MTSRPTMIEPARYIMSAAHMSACFASLGLRPPKSEIYADLPPASADLPQNLTEKPGALSSEAAVMFTLLARPARVVIANEFFGGAIDGIETRCVGDAAGDNWVIVSKKPGGVWDLARLTSRAQFLAVMDGIAEFGEHADPSEAFLMNVSVASMAALAAVADTVRLGALRCELEGVSVDRVWLQNFAPDDLLKVTQTMQSQMAVTSKVLLLQLISAGATSTVQTAAEFEEGVSGLVQAGVLEDDRRLSFEGHQIVSFLLRPEAAFSFHCITKQGSAIAAQSVFFLQAAGSTLGGVWHRGDEGKVESVLLTALSPAQAMNLLESAAFTEVETHQEEELQVKSMARFCSHCGAQNMRQQNFCPQCGEAF